MLKTRMQQVWKRLWVVVLITGLAVLAAVWTSTMQRPTYVGKSTLVVSSPGKTTEQDAILVAGYAALFNDPATTARLRSYTKIPDGVSFQARLAAASPILTIQATANGSEVAQDASQEIANAFRNDINAVRQEGNAEAVVDLKRQLDQLRSQPGPPDAIANPQLGVLQDRIDSIKLDSTNQLQDLQLRAGVTGDSPHTVQNVALAAVGGLILGILAALGLAAISTRLTSSADIRDKTGVNPLAEISWKGSSKRDWPSRGRLAMLANILSLDKSERTPVVAFTDARDARGSRDLALAVAELWARQDRRTVLIDAVTPSDSGTPSFAGAGSKSVLRLLQDGAVGGLKILPAGGFNSDRYSLLTSERISAVVSQLSSVADMVVIAAPPIADTAEAQVLCAAAHRTILVVTRRSSKTTDVKSAAEALRCSHAVLEGAVLVDGKRDDTASAEPRHSSDPSSNGRPAARKQSVTSQVTL